MHHIGGRIVDFQQLAEVQLFHAHGGLHLLALGAEDVAEGGFLQGDALQQVDHRLIQRDAGQRGTIEGAGAIRIPIAAGTILDAAVDPADGGGADLHGFDDLVIGTAAQQELCSFQPLGHI